MLVAQRHYEIVWMFHPDRADQVDEMLKRYREVIKKNKGTIHRSENWGRRFLAYHVNGFHKAHYALMNIECPVTALDELKKMFRINDAVIRFQILKCSQAITQRSTMLADLKMKAPNKIAPISSATSTSVVSEPQSV
jgi:small subunit ribosomal protein S6